MTTPALLIVGATGTIGRHLVRLLLERRQPVRVLARDPAKAAALGDVEVVEGDLSKPETLTAAFAGIEKVFVLAPPVPNLAALEGAAFDAAKAAGARQVVYLSNFGAGSIGTSDMLWHWHGESERRLREVGLAWTILRPARFMTDVPFPWSWDRDGGVLAEPLGAGKVTMIAPEEIAEVAAKALLEPGHDGQIYELTAAEALGGAEIAEALGKATGKPVRFVDVAPAVAREAMVSMGLPPFVIEFVPEYYSSVREGRWYVTSTAADLLGRPAVTFAEWLRRRGAAGH
jgi:uncharacterized protein YbjT (DUF2867 family)